MKIEIIEEKDSEFWNKIVNGSINGTLYHTWEWIKIVETNSHTKLFPLVFFDRDDNKPFGAIPLFYMNKLGVKMVFSPPPGSSITLGPILIDKNYKQHKFELSYLDFQTSIEQFIKKQRTDYISIITSPGLLDVRPFIWDKFDVTPNYTYKIDLSLGEENIWKNLSDHLRKNIRKAQKNQLIVTESAKTEDVDRVYYSLKKRYDDQGLNFPVSRNYLQDLISILGNSSLIVYMAIHDQKVVGATLCSKYKDTVTALIGGARNESNYLEAMELIRWEAICRAIKQKYKWFELYGANTRRLCDSKSQFSPSVSLYFELEKKDLLGSLAKKAYFLIQNKYI